MAATIAQRVIAATGHKEGSAILLPTRAGVLTNHTLANWADTNDPAPEDLQKKGHMRNSWDPNSYGE